MNIHIYIYIYEYTYITVSIVRLCPSRKKRPRKHCARLLVSSTPRKAISVSTRKRIIPTWSVD